jgi:hypothetical protein
VRILASRFYSAYFIIIILLVLSQDYSYKKTDNLSAITRKLRNFRPASELREQFLYGNTVWFSCSLVLVVSKGEM